MNNEKQLKQEIENKQNELKELEQVEPSKVFQEFTFEGKRFKIYKWENIQYGDLINNLPKNERLAEFQEFNEAVEEKAFEMEIWSFYITKHFNKLKWEKDYCLSAGYLGYDSQGAFDSGLWGSNGSGRVVVIVEDLFEPPVTICPLKKENI